MCCSEDAGFFFSCFTHSPHVCLPCLIGVDQEGLGAPATIWKGRWKQPWRELQKPQLALAKPWQRLGKTTGTAADATLSCVQTQPEWVRWKRCQKWSEADFAFQVLFSCQRTRHEQQQAAPGFALILPERVLWRHCQKVYEAESVCNCHACQDHCFGSIDRSCVKLNLLQLSGSFCQRST